MRHGRAAPSGWLPVFSVGDAREAEELLRYTCGTNLNDDYIARELAREQTLDNLFAFGERLRAAHDRLRDQHGAKFCRCQQEG